MLLAIPDKCGDICQNCRNIFFNQELTLWVKWLILINHVNRQLVLRERSYYQLMRLCVMLCRTYLFHCIKLFAPSLHLMCMRYWLASAFLLHGVTCTKHFCKHNWNTPSDPKGVISRVKYYHVGPCICVMLVKYGDDIRGRPISKLLYNVCMQKLLV